MAKIAHTQNDVKKRRATFEERWKTFQGNMYDEEQIRKAVFAPIKVASLNTYFSKNRNPLFGFENGVFSYKEEPFRQALSKAKADLSQFKMSESKVKESRSSSSVLCHSCVLTYQDVQMKIERRSIEDSPFGSYTVTPALQLPVENAWVVPETQFYWLNLPQLLMDMALEYSIRQEEFNYHLRQLKVFNMNTTVFDESDITLSDNPDEWMPSIENYFLMMKTRYDDEISFEDFRQESRFDSPLLDIMNLRGKLDLRTLKERFNDLCKEMDVNVEFKIGDAVRLTDPNRVRRTGSFKVDGYELYVEEFQYYIKTNNKCLIYPYHQHPEYSFTLSGNLSLNALVRYLKQMPDLCRQIDKFANNLNF